MGLNGYVVIGWTMGAVLLAAGAYWLARTRIIRPNGPDELEHLGPEPVAEPLDDVPVR